MNSSIAAIHVAKKRLALDDDTYRAKLTRLTGKSSVRDMTEAERQKVLTVLHNEGFISAAGKPAKGLSGKYAKKLQALWIAGYNLGVVRDRRDAALLAFVRRQTGLDHTRFLHHPDDARAAIEALKSWVGHEAGIKWSGTKLDWLKSDGAKIAWAQWKLLRPDADLIARKGFDEDVARLLGQKVYYLVAVTDREWQTVMNAFGERVRAMKGGA